MYDLNFNIFNSIIFSGILQGLIFSFIVLFHKKYKSETNSFIALTVLALSISNLQYWIIDVGFLNLMNLKNSFRIPCDWLIVPFFFLFVNSYLQNKNSKKLIFLLITPFLISLFFNLLIFNNIINASSSVRTINIVLESLSLVYNLTLIFMILLKIKKYEKEHKNYIKTKVKVETKWLKQILLIGGIICLFWFLEILYMQIKNNTGLSIYYPLWISISILVYWISYVGIFHSKVNNERELIRNINISSAKEVLKLKKIKKSNIELYNNIMSWIIEEELYLNSNLDLSMIADKFSISNGYLSQLFSANNEFNFNEYINILRVEEAKKMLAKMDFDNYTILAIGLESGFNSKSSFYTAFKKFTNQTPAEFKKEVRNN